MHRGLGRLVLVHSPLVGPATWSGVAGELSSAGYDVIVPDLTPTLEAGPPYSQRQAGVIAGVIGRTPAETGDPRGVVLVGHSGAGALLGPASLALDGLVAGSVVAGSVVAGCVFADAGLPIPGRSQLSTMPPDLAEWLVSTADADGWLPPWSSWWGDDELALLVPDAGDRQRFAADCPRLPLAMFEELQPEGDVGLGAFLRLSEVYDEPARQARARGWPVIERDSHHLAPVTHPAMVATALAELAGLLAELDPPA